MNAVLERPRAASQPAQPADRPTAFGPAIVVQPTSPKEIIAILRDRKRYPSPVRAMGSGSAVTRCVTANGGTLLDMSRMTRIIKTEDDCVTVQPGITLPELADHLRQAGLELKGGFDLANRSVGGAVCSPGLEATIAGAVGQFAGHVVQLKVVSPEGKKFVVSDNTKNMLGMMRLSYGLLGIVYEVTLRVRPIRGFSVQTAKLSFEDFAKLETRLRTARAGVKLSLLPFRNRIFMELRRDTQEAKPHRDLGFKLRDWAMYSALPTVARSLARAMPYRPLRYPLMDNISEHTQSWTSSRKPSSSSNAIEQSGRMRILRPDRFYYCTWAFPAEGFTKVAGEYRDFSKRHYEQTGFRCDMPTIAFRMPRDRSALLSPSFDGPVMTLSPLSTQDSGWDDFMFDFAEFAATRNGIPFFNQTTNAAGDCASRTYGKRLELFAKMRETVDPGNRLLNQYFAAYMTGASSL
jgi:L-gulonolactone oxidase